MSSNISLSQFKYAQNLTATYLPKAMLENPLTTAKVTQEEVAATVEAVEGAKPGVPAQGVEY